MGNGPATPADLDAYLRVIRVLAEAPNLQSAAPNLVEAIADVFGWQAGTLWLVDETEQLLSRAGGWSSPELDARPFEEAGERIRFGIGTDLPGRVWASGEPAWIEDLHNDRNFPRAKAAAAAGLRAGVAFPIRGTETVGVFEFFSRSFRPLDERATSSMSAFGRQVGQVIERWRAEDLLRASEELKAAVIGAALDCVITMNADGRVVDFNPSAERTFGYSREQAIGEELASLIIPPELRDRHRKGLSRVLRGAPSPILNRRIELTGVRANGAQFPVELTVVQARSGERPLFAGFIRDVSDRKRAEEAQGRLFAAEREARLRAQSAQRRSRELAATLQQSLLPPRLPEIPGIEVAARFRAGGEGVDVGGDFYDVVNSAPNGWGLVVGDVCGKGPAAATVAGLARYTVRAIVMREAKPSYVLAQLNETLLAHDGDSLTSAAYLEIDGRDMCVSIGGHPLPLLITVDGRVEEVGETGTILGFTTDPDLSDHSFRLEDGQLLLFYTDGVTETRTGTGRLGVDGLRMLARECAGASPAELVDHVLECGVDRRDHSSEDDVALVAVRPH